MKLNTDFNALHEHASEMGFSRYRMRRWADAYAMTTLQSRLSDGIGIGLDNLQVTGGVLGLNGLQVFLYNPDQGKAIDRTLANKHSDTHFHLAQCPALREEINASGSVRHVAANCASEQCRVFGFSGAHQRVRRGVACLQVCEQCLYSLNYKGYRSDPDQRARIRDQFNIAECFARFGTLFGRYPTAQEAALSASDWASRSALYRRQRGDTCERCAVGLRSHKHLLCTAHRNADKQDCRPENLQILCLDCQRKEVAHSHLPVREADMRLIQQCRRAQGLLDDMGWDQAIALADSAFDGLIRHYRELAHVVPEVAYQLEHAALPNAELLEVAWPSQKRAVTADLETARRLAKLGWHCLTLDEALANMNGH